MILNRYIFGVVLALSFLNIMGSAALADSFSSQKPASQEQLDERELESLYGMAVERDRLDRGAQDVSTRDRYGDGVVSIFQDNTKNARNLDTNDSIGLEIKLFEFK